MQQERDTFHADTHQLCRDVEKAELEAQSERERADALERELEQAKAQIEAIRRIQRAELEARSERKRADALERELHQVQTQIETVRQILESRDGEPLQDEEEPEVPSEENLQSQIQTAESVENDEADWEEQPQGTEQADDDRGALERQYFSELRAQLEDADRQLKEAAMGLREELQRVEHELREARHAERSLLEEVAAERALRHDAEQNLENSERLLRQMLDVAIAFRNSHSKAVSVMSTHTTYPSVKSTEGPSPTNLSDPAGALELLRAFDHEHFLGAVTKTGTDIRKWQKLCKTYRERAKGKISFRNFAKGDLALFLPTRKSPSKPWAAFNVTAPHRFLSVTGHLAEQLKTREWIVARIASITEHAIDDNDLTSNPYDLIGSTKYYVLEVEDWTQPSQGNKHKTNLRRNPAVSDDSNPENED